MFFLLKIVFLSSIRAFSDAKVCDVILSDNYYFGGIPSCHAGEMAPDFAREIFEEKEKVRNQSGSSSATPRYSELPYSHSLGEGEQDLESRVLKAVRVALVVRFVRR